MAMKNFVNKFKSGDKNVKNKQSNKANEQPLAPFTAVSPCVTGPNQVNQEFLDKLTGSYQDQTHDRKSCYMCVAPVSKSQLTKFVDSWYYPASHKCPNINSNAYSFTGPTQDQWAGQHFTGNEIAWLTTPFATPNGGEPLIRMTANHNGDSNNQVMQLGKYIVNPCHDPLNTQLGMSLFEIVIFLCIETLSN